MNKKTDKELNNLIKPYVKRILMKRFAARFTLLACIGFVLGVILMAASFVFPIENALLNSFILSISFIVISGVILFFVRPKYENTLEEIDKYGFKERLQTMFMLKDDNSPFAVLQRNETKKAFGEKDPKDVIPITQSRRPFIFMSACIMICFILALLPNSQNKVLDEKRKVAKVMETLAEKLELDMEEVAKDTSLSDAEKLELNEKIKKLVQELKKGDDYKEGIKHISEMQKEISELQKNKKQKEIATMKEALAKQPNTKDLSEKIDEEDARKSFEDIKKEVEDALKADEENGNTEKSEKLAESLSEVAKELGESKIKDALENLSEALKNSDMNAVSEALEELQEAMESSEISGTSLEQLNGDLKLSKSRMSQMANSNSTPTSASPSDSQSSDGSQSDSQGQNAQQGSQGSQSSQGSQGQQGGSGGQQGSGGQNGSQGQNGSGGNGNSSGGQQGSGQGAGAGSGDLVESEKIYDDKRIDGGGEQVQISGDMNENGERFQAETEEGEGSLDGYLPYQEVVGEYADDAVSSVKREQFPPVVQDWVERYFSALQE